MGTFRTIANYLFYALGFSILLTCLFITLIGVYFDTQASPESPGIQEIVDEKPVLKVQEGAAPREDVDVMPSQGTQEKVSAPQESVEATPIPEATQEVV